MFRLRLKNPYVISQLSGIGVKTLLEPVAIEAELDKVNNILTQAADIPSLRSNPLRRKRNQKRKKGNKTWFTTDLARLRLELKKSGQTLVKNPTDAHIRENFFKLKRKYKTIVLQKKRKFKQELYNKLENFCSTNPKEYWELFNEIKSLQNGCCEDRCPIDESEWIRHYTKLLGHRHYEDVKIENIRLQINELRVEPFFNELYFSISHKEITKAVKSLKNNKAVGFDQINKVLKFLNASIIQEFGKGV